MNSCLKMKMKVEEGMSFMKNGRLLLEELIAFAMGKAILSLSYLQRSSNEQQTAMTSINVFYGSLSYTRIL